MKLVIYWFEKYLFLYYWNNPTLKVSGLYADFVSELKQIRQKADGKGDVMVLKWNRLEQVFDAVGQYSDFNASISFQGAGWSPGCSTVNAPVKAVEDGLYCHFHGRL